MITSHERSSSSPEQGAPMSVGSVMSLAEREMKKLKGTIHRHTKKKEISCTRQHYQWTTDQL